MGNSVTSRLHEMGIRLPKPPKPVASYAGYRKHGDLLYVSGQLPFVDGALVQTGLLGLDVSVAQGAEAARICAINILAQLADALDGDLERIEQCVRLGGFVASHVGFHEQPAVINGASDLIAELLGERGIHARAAVGVAVLPMNASVEVEGLFAVR